MKINYMKYPLLALIGCLCAVSATAQETTEPTDTTAAPAVETPVVEAPEGEAADSEGGLNEEVNIYVGYKPTIMQAEKREFQPALLESEPTQSSEFKYETVHKQISTEFELQPIKPARMRGVQLDPLQRGYLKGGLGNHLTTFGEVYINNLRQREKQLGFYGKHLASRGNVLDKGHSAFSENSTGVFAKKYMKTHLVEGAFDYNRSALHYYDYDPELRPEIGTDFYKQRYHTYHGHTQLMSFYKDSTMLNYDLHGDYWRTSDRLGATEHNGRFSGVFDKYIGKEHYTMDAVVDYNRYSADNTLRENTIVGLRPNVISNGKRWRLKVGLGVFAEVGTIANFHFYPDAYFKYNVVDDMLIPYLGVTGGLERTSFRNLTDQNPFLASSIGLMNTDTRYELFGGVRGAFSSTTSFNLRASTSRVANMPLFVNDEGFTDYGRFVVLYDTVNVLNLRAEAAYRKGEKLNLLLRGEYFNYNPDNEFIAWHMPNFKATLIGRYNLHDKIVARADIFYLSGQKAKSSNPADGEDLGYDTYAKELKGVADFNLGLEYRYNKRLSAWLQFNNLGGFRYNRWNGYPTQRFTALGGITYNFWGPVKVE